jgi:hypothetical protein
MGNAGIPIEAPQSFISRWEPHQDERHGRSGGENHEGEQRYGPPQRRQPQP